jgi:hypothetical protein
MGLGDAAKALAEGQRAARSAIPEWDWATRQREVDDGRRFVIDYGVLAGRSCSFGGVGTGRL